MSDSLSGLNPKQLTAVKHGDGPLMVLAGAGSGKTKVLVSRVAYLIEQSRALSDEILLVTFTNKAAGEMRDRVAHLLRDGLKKECLPWAGTFHSFCSTVIRNDGEILGISNNYTIFDETDRQELVKQVMSDMAISTKETKPQSIVWAMSSAKNELLSPLEYGQYARGYFQDLVTKVYLEYQKRIKAMDALDFDDLILETVKLWQRDPGILDKYRTRYKYLLVDEYQDTNRAQYQLTKMLASKWRNITVVGDASQAIYGWRGANYRNLLNLKSDYPDLTTVNLEQNYRSTQIILDAATAVISKNNTHPILQLWTDKDRGEKVIIHEARSEIDEAQFVVSMIKQIINESLKTNYGAFAVLLRTNAQSRVIEEAFLHAGISYILVGGIRFYERKEIKDVLAYLRFLANPKDTVAKNRIEKIGKGKFANFENYRIGLPSEFMKTKSTIEILDEVLRASGYLLAFDLEDAEDRARAENIKELRSVAEEFKNLLEFLQNVALTEKEGKIRSSSNEGAVTIMTLHAAKGLEFPIVFIPGMEEGLFPHSRALMDKNELEEERRLCYVGITRAKDKLFLCYATRRLFFGQRSENMVSRFIAEIPEKLIKSEQGQPFRLSGGIN